jgi:uncharacterized protein YbjQ (UPF0145 family)
MFKQRAFNTILPLILLLLLSGCAYLTPTSSGDLPPVLAQDEVIRPYVAIGRIQITREVYGSNYTMTADIRNWGITAVREEAAKMGADAVILPEVTGQTITYAILPATEYRATGVAIKFK